MPSTTLRPSRRSILKSALATALLGVGPLPFIAGKARAAAKEINIDFATYNPLSLVLKDQGLLEQEFAQDGTTIRWVQSLGSNKALEFLNAGSIDFGSTAGAAALIGRINGNPVKVVGVYSRPEWTALVGRSDSTFASVADLKGKKVAVTRGTDPHIFLIRALNEAGLAESDLGIVLLQHPDGKAALLRGDVDAWAGLDPLMAQAEVESGARLFYRNAAANSWGVINVREAFAKENPETVKRVLAVYEQARQWARAHPAELKALLAKVTKLPDAVVTKQLERTDFSNRSVTNETRQTITLAGEALQKASVIKPDVDVKATVDQLIDTQYAVAAN
ncbi:MAG TPA: aliphatic sulfonate ABC transporter substrate-binding protein [Terriglobia bacterium]|nr:aliphatic sulfonate ABC transporter substrate-binding protein [Terriglobia bacterium]